MAKQSQKYWIIIHVYGIGAAKQYKTEQQPEIKGAFVHFVDEKNRHRWISGNIDVTEIEVKE